MVQLYGDERIDFLLAKENMRIIQSPSVFAFSLDAVLLADFTYVPKTRGKILDLCTGNGVVPLFLSTRSKVPITGVEIQERLYDMALRNIELNGLKDQLKIIHGDLKEMPAYYGNDKFDLVTCNPPYFPTPKADEQNLNQHLAIARHEIHCSLEEVIDSCSRLAKSGGKVSMVHRPERLVEIIQLFNKYKLEPKRMRLVYPKEGKEANILLIEGVRDGKPGLKILPPLYALTKEDEYTAELKEILYGE
ncbi:tRNA1(Val) A37 N6-methylase TrmN6 [Halobacillus karajensis]|uniref:Methyltransferase n=1 Tax=Halobacillus karajensis TaxID=195088 RepID=A0A024PBH8_9BACI|nr:tRNA1(Val) (adenine(37)-N6)-methyltransferase [Halobacillus karajensis]CDQ21761.1 putative methyltransferase [Halobacillus karajensis]CDQ25757.1 putative methyltransferase [Halobacillus karajensis]CDQ29758.1 putative methyltransferase [Halobacillus karajensis]SEI12586.1 tRNA1(Val) A37 N6-methylase TrmN6 [Halobacillus karajensis]